MSDVQSRWADERYLRFVERATATIDALHTRCSTYGVLASRLRHLAAPLDAYLGTHISHSTTSMGPTAVEPTSFSSRDGRSLDLMRARDLDPSRLDWGDPAFAERFATDRHHGWTAEDYRSLARDLPTILAHLRAGRGRDALPNERLRRSHDAFFGSDPIVVDLTSDGRMTVVDGRHRLFACAELGVDAPAWIRRVQT